MDISRPVLSVRRLPIINTCIQVCVKVTALIVFQDIAIANIICISFLSRGCACKCQLLRCYSIRMINSAFIKELIFSQIRIRTFCCQIIKWLCSSDGKIMGFSSSNVIFTIIPLRISSSSPYIADRSPKSRRISSLLSKKAFSTAYPVLSELATARRHSLNCTVSSHRFFSLCSLTHFRK